MIRNSRLSLLVLIDTDPVTNYSCHIAVEAIKNFVVIITYIADTQYLLAMTSL